MILSILFSSNASLFFQRDLIENDVSSFDKASGINSCLNDIKEIIIARYV